MDIKTIMEEDYSEKFDTEIKNDCDHFSSEFQTARISRVLTSHYKYGSVKENYKNGLIEALGSCILCLEKYEKTHNTEYLADAANYLMFEYMFTAKKYYPDEYNTNKNASLTGNKVREYLISYTKEHDKTLLIRATKQLMLEFDKPLYKDAYFRSTDSKESAGKVGVGINEMKCSSY